MAYLFKVFSAIGGDMEIFFSDIESVLNVLNYLLLCFYAFLVAGILCASFLVWRGSQIRETISERVESLRSAGRGLIGLVHDVADFPSKIIHH